MTNDDWEARQKKHQELHRQVGGLAANALIRSGFDTLDDLRDMDDQQLLGLRNFGESSLRKVRRLISPPPKPWKVRPLIGPCDESCHHAPRW